MALSGIQKRIGETYQEKQNVNSDLWQSNATKATVDDNDKNNIVKTINVPATRQGTLGSRPDSHHANGLVPPESPQNVHVTVISAPLPSHLPPK